jgi:hypothetical protein
MRAQIAGQRLCGRGGFERGGVGLGGVELDALVHQHRRALGELAGLLVGRGQGAGLDLGRLHVGLVEGVDAHHRAGHSGGHLPGEELAEDLVEVGDLDVDDRMAGGFDGGDLGVLAWSRRVSAVPQRM